MAATNHRTIRHFWAPGIFPQLICMPCGGACLFGTEYIKNVLPFSQYIAVNEIVSTSKVKNKRSPRYSENQNLLCMLFQVQSPCECNFLLKIHFISSLYEINK